MNSDSQKRKSIRTKKERYSAYYERLKREIIKSIKGGKDLPLTTRDLEDLEEYSKVSLGTLRRIFDFDRSGSDYFPSHTILDRLVNWLLEVSSIRGWNEFIRWFDSNPDIGTSQNQGMLDERESTVESDATSVQGRIEKIGNAIVSTFKGMIRIEIDVFPDAGYRSVTLIYRGRGGNFQRPVTSAVCKPSNLASLYGLELRVPVALEENPATKFATATFQLLGVVKAPSGVSLGRLSCLYEIWDHEKHTDSEYLEVYFLDISMQLPSAKVKIAVQELKGT